MHSLSAVSRSIHSHFVTSHAALRMQQRGIPATLINEVLTYGRAIHAKGVTFRVIGKKEVTHFAQRGIDLSQAEGVHVLLEAGGTIITTYRNHNLRGIRPSKRKHAIHH